MRSSRLLVTAAVLLLVGIGGLVLLGSGVVGPAPSGNSPEARGQWIYQTGPIRRAASRSRGAAA